MVSQYVLQGLLTYIFTYSMAQQPLKSFDRTLMRVSLSNSILVTLIVVGDNSIASRDNQIGTKVLLGREYAD